MGKKKENVSVLLFIDGLFDCSQRKLSLSNYIDDNLLWVNRVVVLWAFFSCLCCLCWFMKFISRSSCCDSTEWSIATAENELKNQKYIQLLWKSGSPFQIINKFLETFFPFSPSLQVFLFTAEPPNPSLPWGTQAQLSWLCSYERCCGPLIILVELQCTCASVPKRDTDPSCLSLSSWGIILYVGKSRIVLFWCS